MNCKSAIVLGAILAFFLAASRVRAADAAPGTEAALAGLQISLTTSGYKFFPADPVATTVKTARESFIASALLANRSNTDILFTFPTPAAAQAKWTFRIFNRAGEQLWLSDADVVTPQLLTDATLEKRGRWKRLIQVPLRLDGELLPPGVYTLEASIDSDKTLGATAIFEVALPPLTLEPAQNTGIRGAVVLPGKEGKPAAGALVQISELRGGIRPMLRPPFAWTGRADDFGRFLVITPPGRFRVSASTPATTLRLPATVEVTVTAGAFSETIVR